MCVCACDKISALLCETFAFYERIFVFSEHPGKSWTPPSSRAGGQNDVSCNKHLQIILCGDSYTQG